MIYAACNLFKENLSLLNHSFVVLCPWKNIKNHALK
jgi:hypothetical protein